MSFFFLLLDFLHAKNYLRWQMSIAHLREDYQRGGLRRVDLHADATEQFLSWFGEAQLAKIREPNAMTLATVSAAGQVSARIVLLKEASKDGFVFFTNYHSAKADDLEVHAQAALVFHWEELERQVRVTGVCAKVSREETDAYFQSRPRGSQIGAWASSQSEHVTDRAVLEQRMDQLEKQWIGQEIPVPDFWGGYALVPQTIEFWQGRSNRLHDRFLYTRSGEGWGIARLSP